MSVHIIMMLIPSMYIHLIDFFSLNASKVGLVFSIASFCFGIGSLPMSFLYNKYGPKTLIAFSQIGLFASALLVGFSNNIVMFSISNILLGLFASIHHPVSLTLISEVFEKNISKANAFHGVFGSIGVSLGPLISYYALMYFSWHHAFIFTAFFNVILIPLTLKIIPDTEKIDVLQLNDFNDRYQNSILKFFLMISFFLGIIFTGIDQILFRGKLPFTLKHKHADHETLKLASEMPKIEYPKPDNVITFDKTSSVYLTGTNHADNQPVHLKLKDPSLPIKYTLEKFDEPAQRYCPAGVYEVQKENDISKFVINSQNCIHCKTCDIKEPSQNITWVTPEGGGGPKYGNM